MIGWAISLRSSAIGWVMRLFGGGKSKVASLVGGKNGFCLCVGVAAIVGAGIYLWKVNYTIRDQRAELRVATADTRVAVEANRQFAAELEKLRQMTRRATDAIEAERLALEERLRALSEIRKEIDNAPDADDGPVAPVLGDTLDRLRGLSGADGSDQAAGRAPAGSEGTADVPADADGSDG